MKLFLAIVLAVLLVGTSKSFATSMSVINGVYQFDKNSMIQQKLKKAEECINQGNYTAAKNYLESVLKLDKNNAKAKELLLVCKNGGRSTTNRNSSSNSSSSSYSSSFSVSKTNLSFHSRGGSETLTVSGSSNWSVSVNPASWGHLTRSGNTITLRVDANSSSSSRTDYFTLKSGSTNIRVNINQSGCQNVNTYLNVSKSDLFFPSGGGSESITISSNNTWNISLKTYDWGHLKQEGNVLTITVDANNTGSQRTDFFKLSAGGIEKRINITQSPTKATNGMSMSGTTRTAVDNAIVLSYLTTSIKGWGKCRLGAITESGAGIVVYGSNGFANTGNVNPNMLSKLKELNSQEKTLRSITMTTSGYYCIVYGRNGWCGVLPEGLKTQLNQYNSNKEDIYCVSIAENGDYVIITDKHFVASTIPDMNHLKKAYDLYGHVKYACVTNRGLCVICQNGIYYSNIPSNLEVKLKSISFKPDKITFTDSGTFLITNEKEEYWFYM